MRVTLVDDHEIFRESVRIALSQRTPFEVTAAVGSARALFCALDQAQPDLLVIDLFLADTDGVSLTRELRRRGTRVPVLMLTRATQPSFVRDAFASGARGYVLKHQPLVELIDAMERVAAGGVYLAPGLAGSLAPSAESAGARIGRLSRREREVFCRVIEGLSSKEIARALCISARNGRQSPPAHQPQAGRSLARRTAQLRGSRAPVVTAPGADQTRPCAFGTHAAALDRGRQ